MQRNKAYYKRYDIIRGELASLLYALYEERFGGIDYSIDEWGEVVTYILDHKPYQLTISAGWSQDEMCAHIFREIRAKVRERK